MCRLWNDNDVILSGLHIRLTASTGRSTSHTVVVLIRRMTRRALCTVSTRVMNMNMKKKLRRIANLCCRRPISAARRTPESLVYDRIARHNNERVWA